MVSHYLLYACSEDHVMLKPDGNATVYCETVENLAASFLLSKRYSLNKSNRARVQLKETFVEGVSEEERQF